MNKSGIHSALEGGTKGARVGSFVLDELIATGPYAEIWLAHHAYLTARQQDVKIFTNPLIRQVMSHDPQVPWLAGNRFIPEVVDFRPDHETPFVATRHVEGKNLRQVLREGPLELRRAVAIIAQLVAALKFAHTNEALHLGLKAENLLLDDEDRLTLLDLAVGRFSAQTGRLQRDASAGNLGSSVTRGLRYRSREQQKGEPVDERTDVYAFGLLMFEILTGDLPSGAQLPSQVNSSLPRKFDHIFSRCCTKMEKRYESMDALETDLRANTRTISRRTAALKPKPSPEAPKEQEPEEEPEPTTVEAVIEALPATESLDDGDVVVVDMSEVAANTAIDIHDMDAVMKHFDLVSGAGFRSIVMDFTPIEYIASSGLGYLVNVADIFRERGGQAVLFGMQQKVKTIFEVMGLLDFFTQADDREAAIAAAREKS